MVSYASFPPQVDRPINTTVRLTPGSPSVPPSPLMSALCSNTNDCSLNSRMTLEDGSAESEAQVHPPSQLTSPPKSVSCEVARINAICATPSHLRNPVAATSSLVSPADSPARRRDHAEPLFSNPLLPTNPTPEQRRPDLRSDSPHANTNAVPSYVQYLQGRKTQTAARQHLTKARAQLVSVLQQQVEISQRCNNGYVNAREVAMLDGLYQRTDPDDGSLHDKPGSGSVSKFEPPPDMTDPAPWRRAAVNQTDAARQIQRQHVNERSNEDCVRSKPQEIVRHRQCRSVAQSQCLLDYMMAIDADDTPDMDEPFKIVVCVVDGKHYVRRVLLDDDDDDESPEPEHNPPPPPSAANWQHNPYFSFPSFESHYLENGLEPPQTPRPSRLKKALSSLLPKLKLKLKSRSRRRQTSVRSRLMTLVHKLVHLSFSSSSTSSQRTSIVSSLIVLADDDDDELDSDDEDEALWQRFLNNRAGDEISRPSVPESTYW